MHDKDLGVEEIDTADAPDLTLIIAAGLVAWRLYREAKDAGWLD